MVTVAPSAVRNVLDSISPIPQVGGSPFQPVPQIGSGGDIGTGGFQPIDFSAMQNPLQQYGVGLNTGIPSVGQPIFSQPQFQPQPQIPQPQFQMPQIGIQTNPFQTNPFQPIPQLQQRQITQTIYPDQDEEDKKKQEDVKKNISEGTGEMKTEEPKIDVEGLQQIPNNIDEQKKKFQDMAIKLSLDDNSKLNQEIQNQFNMRDQLGTGAYWTSREPSLYEKIVPVETRHWLYDKKEGIKEGAQNFWEGTKSTAKSVGGGVAEMVVGLGSGIGGLLGAKDADLTYTMMEDYKKGNNTTEDLLEGFAYPSAFRDVKDWFQNVEISSSVRQNPMDWKFRKEQVIDGLKSSIQDDYSKYLDQVSMGNLEGATALEQQIVQKAKEYLDDNGYTMKDGTKISDIVGFVQKAEGALTDIKKGTYDKWSQDKGYGVETLEDIQRWRMGDEKFDNRKDSQKKSIELSQEKSTSILNELVTESSLDWASNTQGISQIGFMEKMQELSDMYAKELGQGLDVFDNNMGDIARLEMSEEDYGEWKTKIEQQKQDFLSNEGERLKQVFLEKAKFSAQNIGAEDINTKGNEHISKRVRDQGYTDVNSYILGLKDTDKNMLQKGLNRQRVNELQTRSDSQYIDQLNDADNAFVGKLLPFLDTAVQWTLHGVVAPAFNSATLEDAVPMYGQYNQLKYLTSPYINNLTDARYQRYFGSKDLTSSDLGGLAGWNLNQDRPGFAGVMDSIEKLRYNASDKGPETAAFIAEIVATRKLSTSALRKLGYSKDVTKLSGILNNAKSSGLKTAINFTQGQLIGAEINAQFGVHYNPGFDGVIDSIFGIGDLVGGVNSFRKSYNVFSVLPDNFITKFKAVGNFSEGEVNTLNKITKNLQDAVVLANKVDPKAVNFALKKGFIKSEIENMVTNAEAGALTPKQIEYVNVLKQTLGNDSVNVADLLASKAPIMVDKNGKPIFGQNSVVRFGPFVNRGDNVPQVPDIKGVFEIGGTARKSGVTNALVESGTATASEYQTIKSNIENLKKSNPMLNIDTDKIFTKVGDNSYSLTSDLGVLESFGIKDGRSPLQKIEGMTLSKDASADSFYRKAVELGMQEQASKLQNGQAYEKVLEIFSNVLC